MSQEEYVTVRQAREMMGITEFKMTALIKNGEFTTYPTLRDKRVRLIKRADVEAWIAKAGPLIPKGKYERKQEDQESMRPAA